MKLGISEIILLFFIVLILFGPAVYGWLHRAGRVKAAAQRQRRVAEIQAAAVRDELLARFRLAGAVLLGLLLGGILLYLLLWPVRYAPQSYTPNRYQMQTPDEAGGQTLALDISPYRDPVCVTLHEGWLYAAVQGGTVIRIRPDGTGLAQVLSTGGEITSLAFGSDGALYLTDARLSGTLAGGGGVLRAVFDGWAVSVEPLVTAAGGKRLNSPSAVAVGADGKVYFADFAQVNADQAGGMRHTFFTELLAHTATGSVWVYDPAGGETACLASGLQGVGGLALSSDGQTLYVAETFAYRVLAFSAAGRGQTAQDAAVPLDGLPGYAAGLAVDEAGSCWVAVCGSRVAWVDGTAGLPLVRAMAMRLPRMTQAWLLTPQSETTRACVFSAQGAKTATLAAQGGQGRATAVWPDGSGGCWLAEAGGSTLYHIAAA